MKKKDKDLCDNSAQAAGKVNVVAQELKFAKMLASNDVKIRNGVLKSLQKWLNTRSQSSYRKYLLIASLLMTFHGWLTAANDIQMVKCRGKFSDINFHSHKELQRNLYSIPDDFVLRHLFRLCESLSFAHWEQRRERKKFTAIQLTLISVTSRHDVPLFPPANDFALLLFTEFTNKDFMRLWKGLYYCMWMSDKPLVQEDLTEDLGSLIHCFPDIKVGIQFFRNFLDTMCIEWFGIDQWRIDKFMMVSKWPWTICRLHLEIAVENFSFIFVLAGASCHASNVVCSQECWVGRRTIESVWRCTCRYSFSD